MHHDYFSVAQKKNNSIVKIWMKVIVMTLDRALSLKPKQFLIRRCSSGELGAGLRRLCGHERPARRVGGGLWPLRDLYINHEGRECSNRTSVFLCIFRLICFLIVMLYSWLKFDYFFKNILKCRFFSRYMLTVQVAFWNVDWTWYYSYICKPECKRGSRTSCLDF